MQKQVKVLFSSNRNPNFETFTDYIEKAFKEEGCEVLFFENRDFTIPGRIRGRWKLLHNLDLKLLNCRLRRIAESFKPDLFLEDGGWNILPETIESLKRHGVKTALWTNDAPLKPLPIVKAAPYYDRCFTTDTGYQELYNKFVYLPFACDPYFYQTPILTAAEKKLYTCDVSFVGSGTQEIYPNRRALLEALSSFDLGVWGPGWADLPDESPLRNKVRGGSVRPSEWIKIYAASRLVLCIHYKNSATRPTSNQATVRVFEALACGAFLLVDEQKDVRALFKDGEHLVIYQDAKDMRDKVAYYLAHPEEAARIAAQGREEVLARHTYRHRVREILQKMNLIKHGLM